MVTDQDQEASVLNDLRLWIFLGLIALSVLAVLAVLQLWKRFQSKIREILQKQLKKWRYNQLIQTIDIAYIEVVITVGTQGALAMRKSEWQEPSDARNAMGLGVMLTLLPV